ncbi:hypothetical protein F0919_18030 [Taibaiella lutea]|uniref:Uncharacterized protein n=1 Tax=Taibaiella lutea TaxID=2608001 RepID=A0A5M6CDZ3_9BACT|nr:hypothetical protein [Taibaiella lutea]KAA5532680.1 hypothetical protein F0919_18030 [Taibaiella lutea]
MNTKSIENYNRLRDLLTAQFGFTLPEHTKSRSGRVMRYLEQVAESETANSKKQFERAVIESANKSESGPIIKAISEVIKDYHSKPIAHVVRQLKTIHDMAKVS